MARLVNTQVTDAMPTRFEKLASAADTYLLRNVWRGYCPGGACPSGFTGYVCGVPAAHSAYNFLHTNCTQASLLDTFVFFMPQLRTPSSCSEKPQLRAALHTPEEPRSQWACPRRLSGRR